jgi:hypothetical protein
LSFENYDLFVKPLETITESDSEIMCLFELNDSIELASGAETQLFEVFNKCVYYSLAFGDQENITLAAQTCTTAALGMTSDCEAFEHQ